MPAPMPLPPVAFNQCFLCGLSLTAADVNSAEHIIPKWLQRRFDLWNEEIVLTNGTSIPYRQARIPCCTVCNNRPLGTLESEISTAFAGGVATVRALPEIRLFQWCLKIFYGLFCREHFLPADRMNPTGAPIVQRDLLHDLGMMYHFLQSIRRPLIFDGFVPWSIFVVETMTFGKSTTDFDYYDSLMVGGHRGDRQTLCLAIRVGAVGVISVFADNGAQKEHMHGEIDKFDGIPLHPVQFIQMASLVFTKASLLTYLPTYHWADVGGTTVMHWVNPEVETHWHDWDQPAFESMYRTFLLRYGLPLERLDRPDGPPEFLYDGELPIRMDKDGHRIR